MLQPFSNKVFKTLSSAGFKPD